MNSNINNIVDEARQTSALKQVQRAIVDACNKAHRSPQSVTLVAVSKTFSGETIEPFIKEGLRVFGENRVQEAKSKWPPLQPMYLDLQLHLIGPLQTNKVREAVALFDCIHSVDRPSLVKALQKECVKQNRQPQLFVQVNTGAEPQKAGVMPEETDNFLHSCFDTFGDQIVGLMCIPPVDETPIPHFELLAEIAGRHGLKELSMGMSTDFALAVEYGATHIRVGSAIFGART